MVDTMSETQNPVETRPHVVGIGSSAGGLEALSQFVSGLPFGLDCIYVVAQHMSPSHRSMMAEILARETTIPVRELCDGELPETNVVYIIPPGVNLTFKDERFHLTTPAPEIVPKPSVNLMLQSMAEVFDERAIGIILSGTGSDGTRGLRAIKSAGGLTFVQVPETAKYDGMPRSAIDACVADRILPPDQIGKELERLVRFPDTFGDAENTEHKRPELAQLFERVRRHTRIDFSSYKLTTVQRRLQRRMLATGCATLLDYLAWTDKHPEELDALAKETLISVTEFFRDKEAFRTLERYLREGVARKQSGDELRVWVAGCATGEEAYSLAILCSELITERKGDLRLHVFATDIDNDALTVARRGIYNPAALAEVPPEYQSRYFQSSGNGFEPIKSLRDKVTFARQDMTVDPPFLRIDLVTCRNVLIYFNPDLQAKVLSVLRYALREDGLLFLGRSESVSQQDNLFTAADRRVRIFRPRGKSLSASTNRLVRGKLTTRNLTPKSSESDYERLFLHALADRYAPAMLIDSGCRILHSHGAVHKLVQFPTGTPEMNLIQLIVPELASELMTTLHRARRRHTTAVSRKRRIVSQEKQTWRLAIHPLDEQPDQEPLFLVIFELVVREGSEESPPESLDTGHSTADPLEQELVATRDHLQTLTEEMAASSEEMQALNEEVQATNEELQATNEELEASNEELQASNEELVSVNEESLAKSAELAAINSDFESVYNTLVFPILVFDNDLFLKRANGAAVRAFDLPLAISGQHIDRLALPPYLAEIDQHLNAALRDQRKESFTARHSGRAYQIYLTPAINSSGTPQGVVLVVIDNTELVSAQEQTRQSQEHLLAIMNHSGSLVMLKDTAGRYEFVNRRFEEVFNLKAEAVIGKTDRQLFLRTVADKLRVNDLQAMARLEAVEAIEEIEYEGKKLWLHTISFPIFDHDGTIQAVCTEATDITLKRHAQEQLNLAAKVFDRAGEAIVITNADGQIITANEAFSTITGYGTQEVIGQTPGILRSGRHDKTFYEMMWRTLKETGSWQGEIYNKRKNGEIYAEWLTINSVLDERGQLSNYVAIFSDISAIKSSQRKIEFMATHDELTGLPNRGLLMDRLKHSISRARREHHKLAVLFIDLDNFKVINDSLGHDVGDLLLKEAASRLQQCVRDSDTLARLGGDEFVILLVPIDLNEINAVATRIVDYLAASFPIRDHHLHVSASIGISLYPEDGEDSGTLLKNADTAMYRSKERGRNQFQFFADEMKVRALQRLTLESGLRLAIQAGHFRLCYQPQIALSSGRMVGAEALLRWRDPELGEMSPAQFIPLAESCGLINTIGTIVIDLALTAIARWQAAGLQPPVISINVSSYQMRERAFVEQFTEALTRAGVAPNRVCIELTESVLMERVEIVQEMLGRLNRMGVSISIDDFGTGYSSLSYLKRLPIHELKIDRSFVDGIAEGGEECSEDCSIATAIITLAHALNMRVVAEGVETEVQLNRLQQLGCETVQGFLLHRPLEESAFTTLLRHALPQPTGVN